MTIAEIRNYVWTDGETSYIWDDFWEWVKITDEDHIVVSEYEVIAGVLSGRLQVKEEA